ncbi:LysR substrate-binding domain-containing protein [Saccharopolyspora rosea]|uniref:LysR substrate-binding domain-containing protein n=1 Tax=Saccharopolyspora rosea TaxID=524884 RepID=A0ABW3FXD4_9PSEU|nr:LysR substrate-binding domain-containing protein [Saccharopolyspora rosea]
MRLNLHRLWIFLHVVDEGGFSAAAQKLFMSQPSVSNQVRQLEKSLHATLIDRSGARIRPTAEGEVLADYARRIFLLAGEAVAALDQVRDLQAGELAVGGTSTVGTYLLPRLVARFHHRHPGLRFGVRTGNGEQVLRELLDGEVGIAVFADRPDADQVVVEPMFSDRLVLIAPPEHALADRRARPTDLADQRFLMRERGSATRRLQEETLLGWNLAPETADMSGTETLKQGVAAALGVSLISEHAVAHELREGELTTIRVDPEPPARPVVVAYRRDRLLSAAERAFLSLLHELRDWPA